MGIRIIHGNADLVGDAFRGLGEGADKLARQQNVDRELEDREARTAAYLQRIEDARALGQQELELEREELMRENARQDALRKATMGMAQDQVGQFSQSPYWTKQDEAGLRRIFADKSLEEKDRQEIADSYLETVAGRIAEDEVRGQRAKLTDIVQRMAQPDANGNVYLQPDEAEVWGQEIAASDNPARLYEDLRRVVSSAVKVEGVNRQMSQAMTMIDEGLASGQLDDEREEELEDIKARLLTGEIKPSMAKMLARVAVNGDSAALREFSQLVQAGSPALNGGAQPTEAPGGGVAAPESAPAPADAPPSLDDLHGFLEGLTGSEEQKRRAVKRWAKERGLTVEELAEMLAAQEQEQIAKAMEPSFQEGDPPGGRAVVDDPSQYDPFQIAAGLDDASPERQAEAKRWLERQKAQ